MVKDVGELLTSNLNPKIRLWITVLGGRKTTLEALETTLENKAFHAFFLRNRMTHWSKSKIYKIDTIRKSLAYTEEERPTQKTWRKQDIKELPFSEWAVKATQYKDNNLLIS